MKYHDFFGAADAASSCKSESAEIKTVLIHEIDKNTKLTLNLISQCFDLLLTLIFSHLMDTFVLDYIVRISSSASLKMNE